MLSSSQLIVSLLGLFATLVLIIFLGYRSVNYLYQKSGYNPLKSRSTAFYFGFAWSLSLIILAFNLSSNKEEYSFEVEAIHDSRDIEVVNKRTVFEQPKKTKHIPEVIDTIVFVENDDFDTVAVEKAPIVLDSSVAIVDTFTSELASTVHTPPVPPPPPRKEIPDTKTYDIVEEMPRFPGCEDIDLLRAEKESCAQSKLLEYVYSNVKYPSIARENNIQGLVVAKFVVAQDGSIQKIQIVKDIGGGCGNEVERVIESMNIMEKKWRPGRQQGRKVKVMFTLPVKFTLQ